jgi:hypothetical protein
MSWGYRYSTHRERAKPLEGRAAAAHFGCVCLLFVPYLHSIVLFSRPYISYPVVHRVMRLRELLG